MEWVEITYANIVAHMPTDVGARYVTWLQSYPAKEGRLAEITANTIREFRDNLKSVPRNIVDSRETYLPVSAVRHCENIIIFTLAMEMGLQLDSAGSSARTAADIFLRNILYGRYTTTTDAAGVPSPHHTVPARTFDGGRALTALLLFFFSVQVALGAWVKDNEAIYDQLVATTFVPSSYAITTHTLFAHLQGINNALAATATQAWVTNLLANATNGVVDPTARTLAQSASVTASAAINALAGYPTTTHLEDNYVPLNKRYPHETPPINTFRILWDFDDTKGIRYLSYGDSQYGETTAISFDSGWFWGEWKFHRAPMRADAGWTNYLVSKIRLNGADILADNAGTLDLGTIEGSDGISASTATGIAQTVATSYGFAPTGSVQSLAATAASNAVGHGLADYYPVEYATSIAINPSNGYRQGLFLAGTTTVSVAGGATNQMGNVRLDVWTGVNQHLFTNPVPAGTWSTTAVNTVIYSKPAHSTAWTARVFQW